MTSLTKHLNEFGGRLGGGKVLCPVTRLLSRAAKPRTGQPARNSRQCASSHPRCAMAHVLVAHEEVLAPDRIVCAVLLNVGELQTHVARCGDDDSAPETR